MKKQSKTLLKIFLTLFLLRSTAFAEEATVDVKLNLFTTAIVKMRTEPGMTGQVIRKLPINTKIPCSRRTDAKDEIDGFKSHWYFCSMEADSGWIYGGYLATELILQKDKNIFFEGVENKAVGVNLELNKDLSFRLHILQKDNPNATLKSWSGSWSWQGDQLVLTFESADIPEQQIFFKKGAKSLPGGARWEKIKKGVYKINTQENVFTLWGVPCKIRTVFD